jgi:hypothetical protein
MSSTRPRSRRKTAILIVFVLALLAAPVAMAAPGTVVFDSHPNPMPGNVASRGFQATSTGEFGDHIAFAPGTPREFGTVSVVFSSWACQMGAAGAGGNCVSAPGSTFTHPITLNLYEVDDTAPTGVGALITTVAQDVAVPFRPSADPACPGNGGWGAPDCFNGFAFLVEFDLGGMTLPDEVIFGIAFNTNTNGEDPIGMTGPYDSLNVGIAQGAVAPVVGVDPDPQEFFVDTPSQGPDGFRAQASGGQSVLVRFTTVETPDAPVITTTALPDGAVGAAYSTTVAGTTSNPPITWSVTGGSLPPGLTMASDGTISGTPTAEGAFTFTVTATDAVPLTATRDFTITVGPAGLVADLVGLVDPATGIWSLRGAAGGVTTFYYGNPGDVPFAGDWDCDGVDTPGLYRQSDGFVYLRNSNTQGVADIRFFFGNPGDIPMAGDFDNDDCDTVSIYRPSETRFYVINELGANNGGLGPADFSFVFGNPGDKPFVGDFNGDGIDTIGLHRESTGLVYFRQSNTEGIADAEFFFGDPGDRFVAGDWGVVDAIDTPGVFRPSNTTFYLRHTNTQGIADQSFVFGEDTNLPVAGKFAP